MHINAKHGIHDYDQHMLCEGNVKISGQISNRVVFQFLYKGEIKTVCLLGSSNQDVLWIFASVRINNVKN